MEPRTSSITGPGVQHGKDRFRALPGCGNRGVNLYVVFPKRVHQSLLTADPRYEIPAYIGHNGWIGLDVTKECDWHEVKGLTLQSYRHFALKRMLQSLEQD